VIIFISAGSNTDKLIIVLLKVDFSTSPPSLSRIRGINAFIFPSDNGLKPGKLKTSSRSKSTDR